MRYIIGIDEVGRGSLAGPVVVCAAAIPAGWRPVCSGVKVRNRFNSGRKIGLRDSKKLSSRQREAWFKYLTKHPALRYSIARVYPRKIEKLNITNAANLAALKAFRKLTAVCGAKFKTCSVLLDGGLFLGNGGHFPRAKTVVRGDEKFVAVKIASILAKVHRDWLMARLAKKYPVYGFEIHKGYGTKNHLAAIRKYGPSPVHRLTFIPKRYSML